MSLDADMIVDRRRMRRKLTFWRVVAILVAIVAIGTVAATVAPRDVSAPGRSQIARVTIKQTSATR